jgi:hypothetical protein
MTFYVYFWDGKFDSSAAALLHFNFNFHFNDAKFSVMLALSYLGTLCSLCWWKL